MGRYHIDINREECVGDGNCREIAPDTFDIDEDMKSHVCNPDGDPPEDVVRAAKCCRMNVIKLTDSKTGEVVVPTDE